jgi:large subunit ribosomal protein L31
MKQGIHPNWHHDCVVTCSCGNTFTIGSITPTLTVDICSNCHPFFTGEMRFVDRQGRVDRFKKKMEAAVILKQNQATNKKAGSKSKTGSNQDSKTYKDILREQRHIA